MLVTYAQFNNHVQSTKNARQNKGVEYKFYVFESLNGDKLNVQMVEGSLDMYVGEWLIDSQHRQRLKTEYGDMIAKWKVPTIQWVDA